MSTTVLHNVKDGFFCVIHLLHLLLQTAMRVLLEAGRMGVYPRNIPDGKVAEKRQTKRQRQRKTDPLCP